MARPKARRTDLAMSFDLARNLDLKVGCGKTVLLFSWPLNIIVASAIWTRTSGDLCYLSRILFAWSLFGWYDGTGPWLS